MPDTHLVSKVAEICRQAVEMGKTVSLSDPDGLDKYAKLAFNCVTAEGTANPMIAGWGGAIAGLVMVADSVLSRPQNEEYSRWWAAWHTVQGISAVATPAIVDILIRRFTVDPHLYAQLQQPDVLAVTGLQVVMLAIGVYSLAKWSADLVQVGDGFIQTRYQEAREKRISNGLITAALKQDMENWGSDSLVEKRGPQRVFHLGSVRRETLELSRGSRDGPITEEEIDRRGEEVKTELSEHFQIVRNVLNHGLERIKKTAQLQRKLPDSITKRV